MTALARRAPLGGRSLPRLGLGLTSLALGIGLGLAPWLTLAAVSVVTVIAVVAVFPPAAALLVIVSSLLLAGVDRGMLIPLIRPQELVIGLVIVGIGMHALMAAPTGRLRLAVRFDRIDAVLVAMAMCASAVPLAFMLLRDREIERDDVLYALQLWKLYAVFVVVRLGVRNAAEVRLCLWAALVAGLLVGAIGVLQSLGVGAIQALLDRYHDPLSADAGSFDLTRATSTVGSPFAFGDVMIFCAGIAAGLVVRGDRRRVVLTAVAAMFVFFAVSSGQFSIAIGIVVAVAAFGLVSRRLGRSLAGLIAMGIVAAIVLQPVIQNRLRAFDTTAALPRSWQGRLDNLDIHFLPVLTSDYNWVTGVRPWARVPAPEPWRDFVYMESGHVWLLWTGGVALFVAFHVFLAVAMPTMARIARTRRDAHGAAAAAGFTALAVIAVLMIFDVHITLRGAGELTFALLALALPRPLEQGH